MYGSGSADPYNWISDLDLLFPPRQDQIRISNTVAHLIDEPFIQGADNKLGQFLSQDI
jgi:hypothetical protein